MKTVDADTKNRVVYSRPCQECGALIYTEYPPRDDCIVVCAECSFAEGL